MQDSQNNLIYEFFAEEHLPIEKKLKLLKYEVFEDF